MKLILLYNVQGIVITFWIVFKEFLHKYWFYYMPILFFLYDYVHVWRFDFFLFSVYMFFSYQIWFEYVNKLKLNLILLIQYFESQFYSEQRNKYREQFYYIGKVAFTGGGTKKDNSSRITRVRAVCYTPIIGRNIIFMSSVFYCP